VTKRRTYMCHGLDRASLVCLSVCGCVGVVYVEWVWASCTWSPSCLSVSCLPVPLYTSPSGSAPVPSPVNKPVIPTSEFGSGSASVIVTTVCVMPALWTHENSVGYSFNLLGHDLERATKLKWRRWGEETESKLMLPSSVCVLLVAQQGNKSEQKTMILCDFAQYWMCLSNKI